MSIYIYTLKSLPYTTYNLTVNQVHDLRQSEWQVICNMESVPELKTKSYSPEERVADTGNFEKTKLYIKNMVCLRCIMLVKAVLQNLGLIYSTVELGVAEIIGKLSDAKRKQLTSDLLYYGFELLEDKKIIIVEKIKNVIVEMIHYRDEMPVVNISFYIHKKLNGVFSYPHLSHLFTEVTGINIEHYIILQRIERVKEMIVYNDELTLSEIAWKLQYSSIAHLCNQFKQITGFTPSQFKGLKHKRLIPLEDL